MLGRIGGIVRATRGMATPADSRSETARRSVSRKGRLCRFGDSRSPVDGATGAGRPTTPTDPFNPAADGPAPTLGGSVKGPSDARAAWPVEYCQANAAASARPTAAIVILRTPHHTAGPARAITRAYRGRTARFATRPAPATCSRRHADPSTIRHALAGIRGIAPARRDFSSRSLGGTRGASAHVMLTSGYRLAPTTAAPTATPTRRPRGTTAPVTTKATAPAATTTTTTAPASAASSGRTPLTRDVHRDRPPIEGRSVERLDGTLGFLIRPILDEAKTT
jgi:hypothetical protein